MEDGRGQWTILRGREQGVKGREQGVLRRGVLRNSARGEGDGRSAGNMGWFGWSLRAFRFSNFELVSILRFLLYGLLC